MEQNNREVKTNLFFSGINTDIDPQFLNKEGQYTYALNAKLNTHNGNKYTISNEPSNIECVDFNNNLTLIGSIELSERRHAVFFTDNTVNEIGIYNEAGCTYDVIVRGGCLNFSTDNLIVGGSRESADCSEVIYWADGNRNPRRYLKLDEIPYTFEWIKSGDCQIKRYNETELDCNSLLAERNIKVPEMSIQLGNSGQLENGSYQVGIIYSDNLQRLTDVLNITSPQSIFSHNNSTGELEVTLSNLDENFDEFQLILIATVNQQTTYKIIGTYSISTKFVSIYENTGETISANEVLATTPSWYGADGFSVAGDYALWYGVKTRPELNYQSQANKIQSNWVAYRVPKNYYKNGGNKVGYYRDEVYSFAIQWLYKNGKWGPAYHIPGRSSKSTDLTIITGKDSFETQSNICRSKEAVPKWKGYGSASGGFTLTNEDECSEYVAGTGEMSYHESVEEYPNKPDVWGTLACKKIRHHKFPSSKIAHIHSNNIDDKSMIIMGVDFTNIEHPLNFDGVKEKDIVGYRILRETRKGNRSVIARGMLFNMRSYIDPSTEKETLYQNYPFNDLRADPYLSHREFPFKDTYTDLHRISKTNYYSFHSPLAHIGKPKLTATELKIETEEIGQTYGEWNEVYKHPKQKIIRDFGFLLAGIVGMAEAVVGIVGKRTVQYTATPAPLGGDVASVFGSGTGYGTVSLIMYYIGVGIQALANTAIVAAVLGGALLEPWLIPAGVVFADSARRAAKWIPGTNYSHKTDGGAYNSFTGGYNVLTGTFAFPILFNEGATKALDLIYAAIPAIQYAYQYNGVATYSKFLNQPDGDVRRGIEILNYLLPVAQQVGSLPINNYKRESALIIKTTSAIKVPTTIDNSRGIPEDYDACDKLKHTATASSYYATLKVDKPGQYGQLYNTQYLSTGHLEVDLTNANTYSSGPVFGGDCYINKFTVKRKMHYYNQTGFDEKDGWEFDYRNYFNVSYPTHWLDSRKFDPMDWYNGGGLASSSSDFSGSDGDNDPQGSNSANGEEGAADTTDMEGTTNNAENKTSKAANLWNKLNGWDLPHKNRFFSCEKPYKFSPKQKDKTTVFYVEDGKFYLSNNGVINFYCESDFNLDLRDWDEEIQFKHYNETSYTDLPSLFRSDIQDFDNYYKFDKSYTKELTEIIGASQIAAYNPIKAESCYTYYPNQVIYSLPANKEALKDNWLVYLNNNKYRFPKENGKITGVKYLDRKGLMFFFDNSAPFIHQTIDTLQTDSNLKITIGDGGLFSREPSPLSVTDYAFGNCQSKHAFNQTQYGLFYPSQRQGRIFLYADGLSDITLNKEWWFKKFLPSRLLEQFPEYPLKDNPVKGVGLFSSFDNKDSVYYLHKRDFELKPEYEGIVQFDGQNFYIDGGDVQCPEGYDYNSSLGVCEKVIILDPMCSLGDTYDPVTQLCFAPEGSERPPYPGKCSGVVIGQDCTIIDRVDANTSSRIIIDLESEYFTDCSFTISYNVKDQTWISNHSWVPSWVFQNENTFSTVKKNKIWKHNTSFETYCNFYGDQHTFEVEYLLNTSSTSILSSIEYYLECYRYLNNDKDSHHLLDYNFNKFFIYNSEQNSGLRLMSVANKDNPHKTIDSYSMNNTVKVKYYKEEQKYRLNNFDDITRNRGEFIEHISPVINIHPNGYTRTINSDWVDYNKKFSERKRFRHLWHKVVLIKETGNDPMYHMILKLIFTKTTKSFR